jgi:hypothetical protein
MEPAGIELATSCLQSLAVSVRPENDGFGRTAPASTQDWQPSLVPTSGTHRSLRSRVMDVPDLMSRPNFQVFPK